MNNNLREDAYANQQNSIKISYESRTVDFYISANYLFFM